MKRLLLSRTYLSLGRSVQYALGLGLTMTLVVLALVGSLFVAPYEVKEFSAVRADWHASDAWLLDRHGEPLSRVRVDMDTRRGEWTTLTDVSTSLVETVLDTEDRRFHEHAGVDWSALAVAMKQTLLGTRRGGSTITMQLASYLHPELDVGGRRGLVQKWMQIRQALALERRWAKPQVLEAWLNLTPFRGEIEGIDAVASVLLGKRPNGLDRAESALLVALVRAPNASVPRVVKRACALLKRQNSAGTPSLATTPSRSEDIVDARASESDCTRVHGLAITGLRPQPNGDTLAGLAPHVAQRLLQHPGERLRTTLDARVQGFATETLVRHLRELDGRNVEDGALVVLDNASGDVIAWVGSSGMLSRAAAVDGVLAPRQPGSALKPFLYALAIERRMLTAASLLDDSPLAITLPTGLYVPQNYDHSFKGQVSLRQALASSLNVPAVRTIALTGQDEFYDALKRLGFSTLERDANHYGYALALGSAEVTLLDLANAYRALANGGRFTRLNALSTGDDRMQSAAPQSGMEAIDARAAWIVADILADPAARAMTFGLAGPLATSYRASVKTGTSKEMRDNWAVGFTNRFTVGVWVGNASGEPMHDVSGVDGAAPIWRAVMDFLHEHGIAQDDRVPLGLVHQRVTYAGVPEPPREEWFIAGTEQTAIVSLADASSRPRIATPVDGATYAIDPDIPRDRQRLVVTARGAPPGARFVFSDGRAVASAGRTLKWLPRPGQWRLSLVAVDGRTLDSVSFEVRGIRRSVEAMKQ